MRQLKILIKDDKEYIVHILDLETIRNIILTVPFEESDDSVPEDAESVVDNNNGDKIKFEFGSSDELELDLSKPTKFVVYDDYGFEYVATEDTQELLEAIVAVRSSEMDTPDPSEASDIPGNPLIKNHQFDD